MRGAQAPPTTEELDKVTVQREELYRSRPPDGLKLPLLVHKVDIEDDIPTDEEVVETVQGLNGVRAGAQSGM